MQPVSRQNNQGLGLSQNKHANMLRRWFIGKSEWIIPSLRWRPICYDVPSRYGTTMEDIVASSQSGVTRFMCG